MGLFGRDDRSDANKPSPAVAPRSLGSTTPNDASVTLIAKSTEVEGKIEGTGEVRIEGAFKGKLSGPALVTVAQGGEVDAELRAEVISIAGSVRGNAIAGKKIELAPSARMKGDITSPRILIREGATFEGQVFMTDQSARKEAKPPAEKAPAPATPEKD